MLRSVKDIISYPVEATDGPIGKAKDCLFDDQLWTCRHLVVDTGNWLPGKKVLISPEQLQNPEVGLKKHKIPVNLTKKEIEDCPDLDADAPVSRQYEHTLANHYKLTPYSLISDVFDDSQPTSAETGIDPNLPEEERKKKEKKLEEIESNHLWSAHEVFGYRIDAEDGDFGFVEDFIVEDDTWKLLFFVVSTRKWLPGRNFLIDINWIKHFDWKENQAAVALTRERIEASPEYDPKNPINRDYLDNLYDFYGMPKRHEEDAIKVPPL